MKLRVRISDGDPWFVAKDVCDVLKLNSQVVGRGLDSDEKALHTMQTPGGKQRMTVINESGLYSLILRSRKPVAKKFKKWVTGKVLPSIRKTGGYIQNEENINDPEELMARALLIAKNKIDLLEQRNKDLTRLLPVYAYLYNYLGEKPSTSLSARVVPAAQ